MGWEGVGLWFGVRSGGAGRGAFTVVRKLDGGVKIIENFDLRVERLDPLAPKRYWGQEQGWHKDA